MDNGCYWWWTTSGVVYEHTVHLQCPLYPQCRTTFFKDFSRDYALISSLISTNRALHAISYFYADFFRFFFIRQLGQESDGCADITANWVGRSEIAQFQHLRQLPIENVPINKPTQPCSGELLIHIIITLLSCRFRADWRLAITESQLRTCQQIANDVYLPF